MAAFYAGSTPQVEPVHDHVLVGLVKDAIYLERLGYAGASDDLSFAGITFRMMLEREKSRSDLLFAALAAKAGGADDKVWKRFTKRLEG